MATHDSGSSDRYHIHTAPRQAGIADEGIDLAPKPADLADINRVKTN